MEQSENKETGIQNSFFEGPRGIKGMFRYSVVKDKKELIDKLREYVPFADVESENDSEDFYDISFAFNGIIAQPVVMRFHVVDNSDAEHLPKGSVIAMYANTMKRKWVSDIEVFGTKLLTDIS